MDRLRRPPASDLFLLAVLCAVLASWGGVPYFHPDFLLRHLRRAVENGWNPHYFHYPGGLVVYLQFLFYGVALLVSRAVGADRVPTDLTSLFQDDVLLNAPYSLSHLPGHILTICFSTLGVLFAYLVAWRITGRRLPSLMAGLFVTSSMLWVVHSHFLTVDIPLATLCIVVLHLILVFAGEGRPLGTRGALCIGGLVGLCVSVKYTGALILIALAGAMIVSYRGAGGKLGRDAVIIVIAAAALFLVTNPFVIPDFEKFQSDLTYELRHSRAGHFGHTTENGWAFHLTHSLRSGYGLIPLLLAFAGMSMLARAKSVPRPARIAVLAFPVTYFLVIGASRLSFQRYVLPMVPLLGLFSAVGVHGFYKAAKSQLRVLNRYLSSIAKLVIVFLVLMGLGGSFHQSIRHDRVLARADTREDLHALLSRTNFPVFPVDVYYGQQVKRAIYSAPDGTLKRTRRLGQGRTATRDALIILDSFSHDSLIYEVVTDQGSRPFLADEDFQVLQISPFSVPKYEVPFSPESIYSPNFPDLSYRQRPGPFIEIYCSRITAERMAECAHRMSLEIRLLPAGEGYYYNSIKTPLE